jgi:hypothetical protein
MTRSKVVAAHQKTPMMTTRKMSPINVSIIVASPPSRLAQMEADSAEIWA